MLFNQLPVHIFEATSLRATGVEDEDDDDENEAPRTRHVPHTPQRSAGVCTGASQSLVN
jgi:hypothetical protein